MLSMLWGLSVLQGRAWALCGAWGAVPALPALCWLLVALWVALPISPALSLLAGANKGHSSSHFSWCCPVTAHPTVPPKQSFPPCQPEHLGVQSLPISTAFLPCPHSGAAMLLSCRSAKPPLQVRRQHGQCCLSAGGAGRGRGCKAQHSWGGAAPHLQRDCAPLPGAGAGSDPRALQQHCCPTQSAVSWSQHAQENPPCPSQLFVVSPCHRGHSPAPHQCSDTLKGLFLLHSGGESTPNRFKMCLF